MKNIKKQKRYELTPRYQRVRPKYGQSAQALNEALNEAHETLLPAGIALFGLTAWGLNPQEGLRFFHVPWSVKKKGQLLSKIIIFVVLSPFL